ncbi:hypothetical protein QJS66_11220 [Kocuria rhizophila]|nr:hypothetical protein QJS66_11220 [Kocuria rhizophila]
MVPGRGASGAAGRCGHRSTRVVLTSASPRRQVLGTGPWTGFSRRPTGPPGRPRRGRLRPEQGALGTGGLGLRGAFTAAWSWSTMLPTAVVGPVLSDAVTGPTTCCRCC